jgi:hypothetical protein
MYESQGKYGMNFKIWILREMGHIEVQGEIRGKPILAIDPMFEKYPSNLQTNWQSGMNSFFGKLPGENRWLVNTGAPGAAAVITLSPPMTGNPLPPDWWDYARVYYEDGTEKAPIKP